MTITPEQIDIWRGAVSETQKLEFKEAKTQFDNKKLYKYCVALANEGGGHLLLGIANKLPRPVVGSSAFNNPVDMASKLFSAIGFRVDIEEVQHSDGRVVVFSIPPRPIGTAYHFDGAYLMRSGEELVPMSEDQLRKIFTEGQPVFETRIARTDLTAEGIVQLLDTQSYFELIELPYPADRQGVIERFIREKLIVNNGDNYAATNLGALLYAKDLDEFNLLARKSVRVTTYDGNSKLQTKRDIVGKKGYAVGFQGLVDYIASQLPANEVIGKALREAVPMFPEIAIRELVANALIHQDLEQSGGSVDIDVYDNRLEISNPGIPCIEPDRFIDEYQSRNDRMADLMRRSRICEEKGSGFDKVIASIEAFQLPPPDIRVGKARTTIVLFAHKDLAHMDRGDKLRACYQHCVLRYILTENMTNQSLRERFGLNSRQTDMASRIIATAIEEHLIKLEDPTNTSKRYAKYIPYWA